VPITLDRRPRSGRRCRRPAAVRLRKALPIARTPLSTHPAQAPVPDDEIAGFAITTLSFGLEDGCVAELEDLFVRPTNRRGIAGALIDDSAEWAASHGYRTLELVVASNGNDVAHLLGYYARRGFVDEGRRLLSRSLAS
jgi:GNAT superfamily N-acetyltransferase